MQLMVPRNFIGALMLLVSSLAPSGVLSNSNAIIPSTNGEFTFMIGIINSPRWDFGWDVKNMLWSLDQWSWLCVDNIWLWCQILSECFKHEYYTWNYYRFRNFLFASGKCSIFINVSPLRLPKGFKHLFANYPT